MTPEEGQQRGPAREEASRLSDDATASYIDSCRALGSMRIDARNVERQLEADAAVGPPR